MKLQDLPIEDRPDSLDDYGPVFILGCPRSGTTFLSDCIGAITGTREFVGILAPPRMMHLIGSDINEDFRDKLMSSIRDVFGKPFGEMFIIKKTNY